VFDLDVYRVKKKSDSKAPWDYYAPIRKIPAAEAFLPVNIAACGGG
jgi:branched-chain amino acid transport system substrate-binding protein